MTVTTRVEHIMESYPEQVQCPQLYNSVQLFLYDWIMNNYNTVQSTLLILATYHYVLEAGQLPSSGSNLAGGPLRRCYFESLETSLGQLNNPVNYSSAWKGVIRKVCTQRWKQSQLLKCSGLLHSDANNPK